MKCFFTKIQTHTYCNIAIYCNTLKHNTQYSIYFDQYCFTPSIVQCRLCTVSVWNNAVYHCNINLNMCVLAASSWPRNSLPLVLIIKCLVNRYHSNKTVKLHNVTLTRQSYLWEETTIMVYQQYTRSAFLLYIMHSW